MLTCSAWMQKFCEKRVMTSDMPHEICGRQYNKNSPSSNCYWYWSIGDISNSKPCWPINHLLVSSYRYIGLLGLRWVILDFGFWILYYINQCQVANSEPLKPSCFIHYAIITRNGRLIRVCIGYRYSVLNYWLSFSTFNTHIGRFITRNICDIIVPLRLMCASMPPLAIH